MPPARTEYRPSTGMLSPVTEVAPSHGDGARHSCLGQWETQHSITGPTALGLAQRPPEDMKVPLVTGKRNRAATGAARLSGFHESVFPPSPSVPWPRATELTVDPQAQVGPHPQHFLRRYPKEGAPACLERVKGGSG